MESFSLEYWLTQEPEEDYVNSYKALMKGSSLLEHFQITVSFRVEQQDEQWLLVTPILTFQDDNTTSEVRPMLCKEDEIELVKQAFILVAEAAAQEVLEKR